MPSKPQYMLEGPVPSRAQLCLLRSFTSGKGRHRLELSFRPIFLERCGATPAEWDALEAAGHIRRAGSFWELTDAGWKFYRKAKQGRYF